MLYLLRFGELGLEVVGIRSIARAEEMSRATVSSVLILRTFLAIVLFLGLALFVAIGLAPEGTEPLLLLFGLAVFPTAVVFEWVFEAQLNVVVVSIARIAKGLFFGFMVIFFILDQSQIFEAAWYYLASLCIAAIIPIIALMRQHSVFPILFRAKLLSSILKEALPIGGATVLSQYSLFAGIVISGYLVSQEQIGYYSAAHRLIVFVWAYGVVTSIRVILPFISKLFATPGDSFTVFMNRYLRIMLIVSFFAVAVVVSASEDIIMLLFGESYQTSVELLRVLSIAMLVSMIRSVVELELIASNRQRLVFKGTIYLSIAYTVFTLVLVSVYGIVGAPIAAILSEVTYAIFLFGASPTYSLKTVTSNIWRPACVGIGIVITSNLLAVQSILGVFFLGGIGYFFLLWMLGGFAPKDIVFFRELFARKD